ncbi:Outer membrane protein B [invertebrate metagenome]|uniref:Outer membrane protein B n=1 Tax=invertebrate metagenome TaxID=1711999 RepID=A0A2H9TAW1_9ZZZZ
MNSLIEKNLKKHALSMAIAMAVSGLSGQAFSTAESANNDGIKVKLSSGIISSSTEAKPTSTFLKKGDGKKAYHANGKKTLEKTYRPALKVSSSAIQDDNRFLSSGSGSTDVSTSGNTLKLNVSRMPQTDADIEDCTHSMDRNSLASAVELYSDRQSVTPEMSKEDGNLLEPDMNKLTKLLEQGEALVKGNDKDLQRLQGNVRQIENQQTKRKDTVQVPDVSETLMVTVKTDDKSDLENEPAVTDREFIKRKVSTMGRAKEVRYRYVERKPEMEGADPTKTTPDGKYALRSDGDTGFYRGVDVQNQEKLSKYMAIENRAKNVRGKLENLYKKFGVDLRKNTRMSEDKKKQHERAILLRKQLSSLMEQQRMLRDTDTTDNLAYREEYVPYQPNQSRVPARYQESFKAGLATLNKINERLFVWKKQFDEKYDGSSSEKSLSNQYVKKNAKDPLPVWEWGRGHDKMHVISDGHKRKLKDKKFCEEHRQVEAFRVRANILQNTLHVLLDGEPARDVTQDQLDAMVDEMHDLSTEWLLLVETETPKQPAKLAVGSHLLKNSAVQKSAVNMVRQANKGIHDHNYSAKNVNVMVATGDVVEAEGVWGSYIHNNGKQNDVDGVKGYSSKLDGVTVGVDAEITDSPVSLGAAFSAAKSRVNVNHESENVDADFYNVSVYGSLSEGPVFADAVLSYAMGKHSYKVEAEGKKEKASGDSTTYGLSLSAGYNCALNDQWTVQPKAEFNCLKSDADAYKIRNNKYKVKSLQVTELGAGVSLTGDIALENGALSPELSLMGYHDFSGSDAEGTVVADGKSLKLKGMKHTKNRCVAGAGVSYSLNNNLTLGLGYDYDFGKGYKADSVKASVGYLF